MTTQGPPFGVCVSVPPDRAEDALTRLADEGLRDGRYRVLQRDGRVLIPVEDGPGAREELPEAELVETELEHDPRRPPLAIVEERLEGRLSADHRDALPAGWTRLGDVLVLRLPEELEPVAETVARTYADVLGVRSVLHLEGSTGEWRTPGTRLLHGEADTETVHREHGITYRLDPSEVMFSPGNKTERHRLTGAVDEGETVVDLFAGIGYFTLPLADAGAEVVACEVNPQARAYLEANVEANGLADRVEVRAGDCRKVAPSDVADRVMMGYFPGTEAYLETALEALAPEGGWIHFHDAVERPDPTERGRARLHEHPALAEADLEIAGAHTVKTLDPRRAHVVVDARVRP